MFKKVWLKGLKQNRKHQPCDIREISVTLNQKKDQTWQKYVTAETWSDIDCSELVDYDFWIDIDAANKRDLTTEAALRASTANCALLLDYLTKRLSVDYEAISTYFSGKGGFHLLLPFKIPNNQGIVSTQTIKAAKLVAMEIIDDLKSEWRTCSTIDLSIYRKSGLIRFPDSLHHESKLRKVRIDRPDLDLSQRKLITLLQNRSSEFSGQYSMGWCEGKVSSPELEKWMSSMLPKPKKLHRDINLKMSIEQRGQFEGLPSCLQSILNLSPTLNWNRIQFNKAKMFIIGHLKAIGHDQKSTVELGQAFADRYSQILRSSPAKARERREEVVSSATTFYNSQPGSGYDYTVPNRCVAIFASKFPTHKLHPCQNGQCEYADASKPAPVVGRQLSIRDLLKKKLEGNELLIYLTVALEGPFHLQKDVESHTGLKKGTVSKYLRALRAKKLIAPDSSTIKALKPIRDTAVANF